MRREFFHWCDAQEIPTGEASWVWGTQFHYGNIAFGPDSRHIWCGNGGYPMAVTLLDLETRQLALALPGIGAHLGELEFDNEKGWVFGANGGAVRAANLAEYDEFVSGFDGESERVSPAYDEAAAGYMTTFMKKSALAGCRCAISPIGCPAR